MSNLDECTTFVTFIGYLIFFFEFLWGWGRIEQRSVPFHFLTCGRKRGIYWWERWGHEIQLASTPKSTRLWSRAGFNILCFHFAILIKHLLFNSFDEIFSKYGISCKKKADSEVRIDETSDNPVQTNLQWEPCNEKKGFMSLLFAK